MTLIATIFALIFVTELISWIGKSVLLDLVSCSAGIQGIFAYPGSVVQVYALYLRLFYSEKLSQQKKLKSDILANKKDLLQTSAQDQFAKWAKLRRSVDKGLSDLEKLSESTLSALLLLSFHRPTACRD